MTYASKVDDQNFAQMTREIARMQPIIDKLQNVPNNVEDMPEYYPEVLRYVNEVLQRDLDTPAYNDCVQFIQNVCMSFNRESDNYLPLFLMVMCGPQFHAKTGKLLMAPVLAPELVMDHFYKAQRAFERTLSHYQVISLLYFFMENTHFAKNLLISTGYMEDFDSESFTPRSLEKSEWMRQIDNYILKHELNKSDFFDSNGRLISRNKEEDGPDEFAQYLFSKENDKPGMFKTAIGFAKKFFN